MEFSTAASTGNGNSSEAPVGTTVQMNLPLVSLSLPFGSTVGAATMASFSMPSSIFGAAPRAVPGYGTPSVGRVPTNPFLGPTPVNTNFGPNAGFDVPVTGPHWTTTGPFTQQSGPSGFTPNPVGPVAVPPSTVQRPPKFNGTNFKMWQEKMMFFLTVLGLANLLKQDPPQAAEDSDVLAILLNDIWRQNNYLCINYILEGLSDTLYPVYCGIQVAKELWDSLNKKYQARDAVHCRETAGLQNGRQQICAFPIRRTNGSLRQMQRRSVK